MAVTASGRPPETREPIYWFLLLDKAINSGDLQAAAEAQRELALLGVRVAYPMQAYSRQSTTEGRSDA